jgi:hypothetical protein
MVGRKEVRLAMPETVLRVRLIGGDHVDVTYEEAGAVDPDSVTEHAIATAYPGRERPSYPTW